MVDLAVGSIVGAAFGSVVDSLVMHVIMPVISSAVGGVDFGNGFTMLRPAPAPAAPEDVLLREIRDLLRR